MKKLNYTLLILGLFLSINLLQAQEVLLKKKQAVSGFISIESMVSNYDNRLVYTQAANIAVLLNQRFYIGGFSEAMLASTRNGFFRDIDCFEPDFGSAGLMIGTIVKPEKLVHADLRLKLGVGAYRIGENDPPVIIGSNFASDYEPLFVAHPSAGLEINISKFFKINTHVGYRYVGHTNSLSSTSSNLDSLNGLTGQVGLVFGWFGQKKGKLREIDDKQMNL